MNRFIVLALALGVSGAAAPFIILRLRHSALAQRATAERQPTEIERNVLRQRGRLSYVAFVLFWVVSLGLVLASSLLHASYTVEWTVFAIIVMMAAGGVALQLGTLCPICRYRLGYQRRLGVPTRCERCGASF